MVVAGSDPWRKHRRQGGKEGPGMKEVSCRFLRVCGRGRYWNTEVNASLTDDPAFLEVCRELPCSCKGERACVRLERGSGGGGG